MINKKHSLIIISCSHVQSITHIKASVSRMKHFPQQDNTRTRRKQSTLEDQTQTSQEKQYFAGTAKKQNTQRARVPGTVSSPHMQAFPIQAWL